MGSPLERYTWKEDLGKGTHYLFIFFFLCSEGLLSLFKFIESTWKLNGIKGSQSRPSVSHLFFTDDSLLFGKAIREDGDAILIVLRMYELALEQQINMQKSIIYFSPNTLDIKLDIQGLFEITGSSSCEKYFGMPILIGKNKLKHFGNLKE